MDATPTGLESLRAEWDELHRAAPGATTFNGFPHVDAWYRLFAAPGAERVVVARDGDRVLGFLPLVAERRGALRLLRSLTNAHCFHGSALVRAGREADFTAAVLASLRRSDDWDAVVLDGAFSIEGPGTLDAAAIQASGLPWHQEERQTFVIGLGKPFEEWFRRDLTKKRRNHVMNHLHRAEREGGLAVEHLEGEDAVAAWDDFVEIEDANWKGEEGTSIRRETPAYQAYYRWLVERLALEGRLRLSFLSVGGRRVAAGFGHLQSGVLHLAKSGYREDREHLAPSVLLLVELVRDAPRVLPGARAIHLYPWDHGYKHRFANEPATATTTWIFNDTWRGRAAALWREARGAAGPGEVAA